MKKLFRSGILLLLSALLMLSAGLHSYAEEAVFGDADGDGELTAQDASCISRHLNRFRMMDAAGVSRADFDGDGVLTERDGSLILSSFLSSESGVPVTQSFSMLLTSGIGGNAWDQTAVEDSEACTAVNTYSCIQKLREQDPDLLLFDVGGSVFGSSIADDYRQYTERDCGPITSLFIQFGYDAVLFGDEAFSYPSQTVRREVNVLQDHHVPVLGANFQKSEPTIFDAGGSIWNDLMPYVILDVPQDADKPPLRVAVIGMADPALALTEDEIEPTDPIVIYAKLRKELKDRADYTVLLYHGNTEVDAQGAAAFSLRDLLKKTDSIDLVVAAHSGTGSVRSERNSDGFEIPIVSLTGGAETVTRISVSLRETGRPAILVEEIDASAVPQDEIIRSSVMPYVSRLSRMMDAKVCTLADPIEPFDPHALYTTDAMQLTHEMQIFAAKQWIDYHDVDLPNEIISIAYPYIPIGGFKEGTLTYRDLYLLDPEKPQYTLLLIRGSELRAWLSDYASVLLQQETVYSLYGLSYILNSMNPDVPLGYLEHASGLSADDDETFTLLLAEKAEGDLNLKQYLDETWMPYEDRIIEGFALPTPYQLSTTGENPITDALVAYLETVGKLELEPTYTWILI